MGSSKTLTDGRPLSRTLSGLSQPLILLSTGENHTHLSYVDLLVPSRFRFRSVYAPISTLGAHVLECTRVFFALGIDTIRITIS